MGGEESDFGDPGSLFAPQEEISLDDLADAKALTSEFYTDKTVAVHVVLDGKTPFRTVTNAYLSNGDTIVKQTILSCISCFTRCKCYRYYSNQRDY